MEDEEDEVNSIFFFFMAENVLAHVHGAKPLQSALCYCYYYNVLEFYVDLCVLRFLSRMV